MPKRTTPSTEIISDHDALLTQFNLLEPRIPTLDELPDDEASLINLVHVFQKAEKLSAIMIGRCLIRWRMGHEHGDWTRWIQTNFDFSVETASRYIRIGHPAMNTIAQLLREDQINTRLAFMLLRVNPRGSEGSKRGGKQSDEDLVAKNKAIKEFWNSLHVVFENGRPVHKKFIEMSQPQREEALKVWNSDKSTRETVQESGVPVRAIEIIERALPQEKHAKARKTLADAVKDLHAEPISTAGLIVQAVTQAQTPVAENKLLEAVRDGELTFDNLHTQVAIANRRRDGSVLTGDSTTAAATESAELIDELISQLGIVLDNIQATRRLPKGVTSLDPNVAVRQIVGNFLDLKKKPALT